MIKATESMRAPDNKTKHWDRSHVWSQVHTEKQDAGRVVELKWPAPPCCLGGGVAVYVTSRWLYVHVQVMWTQTSIMFWISWSKSCREPQSVNNQISFLNGCKVKCCVPSVLAFFCLCSSANSFSPSDASPVFSILHLCTEWAGMAPWNMSDSAAVTRNAFISYIFR